MGPQFVGGTRAKGFVASLPAVGLALLPKIACPGCWPAYTAALAAMGINFVDYTPFLLPATIVFLLITLGSLALLARRRGRAEPFLLGLAGSAVVLVGKFVIATDPIMYVGIA